ncbi:MAG: DNA repair protein RadC [Clostridiales bacterium]|nr:DNA repair protein RadC [Clostridiales bacterium]
MQIKEMPEYERPQEKLIYGGVGGLSNSELLALIIRTGTSERSVIQLAEDVLLYASTHIGNLGMAEVNELTKIEGIGVAKACSIVASMELAKRFTSWEARTHSRKLTEPSDVAEILKEDMVHEKRELFMAILLNVKLEIESKIIISIGNIDAAPVHPREVFRPAIRKGAAAIIVAHNHPSGDPSPSEEDKAVTTRLREAADLLGIKLLDHVIIGNGRHVSMREKGFLN